MILQIVILQMENGEKGRPRSFLEWESSMETDKSSLEVVRARMIDTLEKSRSATQSYIYLIETTIQSAPNEGRVGAFRASIERQVAANHAFVDRLLRSKDFWEALRIQSEYFQSQLKAAADDAARLGVRIAGPLERSVS